MNFELDPERQMLRSTAREFLAAECGKTVLAQLDASDTGHSPELWRKMADLGWTGTVIPEEYGGVGLDLLSLAVLFEEIGRAAFDGPLFATTVATLAILRAGTDEQKRKWLPQVASGNAVLSIAMAEPSVSHDPAFTSLPAVADGGDYVMQGTKLFVPYAPVADAVLVSARTGSSPGDKAGLTLFLVGGDAPGLRFAPLDTIGPDKQYRIDFENVRVSSTAIVGRPNGALTALRPVLEKATAIQCAEMVGGAARELEITAEYTKERVQFDRPIGTFQAVQHRLADMYTDVQGSRWTTYQAVCRLAANGLPAARELAIAKAFTSDACRRVASGAQQLHGGIGVDIEYGLHFYFRRATALELKSGPAPVHLEALEKEIGLF